MSAEERVYEVTVDGILIVLINPPRMENESYRLMKDRAELWRRYAVNRHGNKIDKFELEWNSGGDLVRQDAFYEGVKK